MAETANDHLSYADHCARLAKLISDADIRQELEALAAQLRNDATHLQAVPPARPNGASIAS